MSFVSRGFRGRRRDDADPARVPPGQYLTRTSPCSRPARPRTRRSTSGTSRSAGEVDEPRALDVGGVPGAARSETVTVDIHCVTKWSKLDTDLDRASRSTRCSRASRRAPSTSLAFCDGGYTTNLPLEDVTGGKAWVAYDVRRRAARARARRPGAAARPAPLLLEEREVGARPRADATTTSPASGRATATTTTATRGESSGTGATDLAAREPCVELVDETPRARSSSSTSPDWPGHRAGPARRRPAHRRGRLPGAAQLLDRVGARGRRARAHRRAARRRRGLAVPRRRAPPGRPARAARPDRRLLRLGGGARRAAAPRRRAARASCRSCRCCATTARSAATCPLRLLYSARTLDDVHLPRRARPAGRLRRRRHPPHAHPRAARRAGRATARRIDGELLAEVAWPADERPLVYVCGPTAFVETAASALVDLGHDPGRIRTERFGPTGGPS